MFLNRDLLRNPNMSDYFYRKFFVAIAFYILRQWHFNENLDHGLLNNAICQVISGFTTVIIPLF